MMKKAIFCFSCLLLFVNVFAQQDSATVLKVGVKEAAPFVMKSESGEYSGLNVELWNSIAQQMDVAFEYVEFETVIQAVNVVERGRKVDICISPLSVTSDRIKRIDFSQPTYISNLVLVQHDSSENMVWTFIKRIFSVEFISAIGFLFVVLLFVGFILWLFERKRNPEQFRAGIRGVYDGLWWSAVTMTTVGYGDKYPRTIPGKIIAIIWMFAAIIVISSFTASIASSLTLTQLGSEVKTLNDLQKKKTGTIYSSSTDEFLTNHKIWHKTYYSVDEMINALEAGEIDVILYDEPITRFKMNERGLASDYKMTSEMFFAQYYSFAFPKDSELDEKVNVLLLQELESLEWESKLKKYMLAK